VHQNSLSKLGSAYLMQVKTKISNAKKTAPQGSCHKTQTASMVLGVIHFGGVHATVYG
jgi:hypothetical protein